MAKELTVTIKAVQVSTSKRMRFKNDVVDLPYGEAKNLIDRGFAVEGDHASKEEKLEPVAGKKSADKSED